jgi:ribosomal protein L37AE/L43A
MANGAQTMNKQVGICPNCKKDIVIDIDSKTGKCPFCETEYSTNEVALYASTAKKPDAEIKKEIASSPKPIVHEEPKKSGPGKVFFAIFLFLAFIVGISYTAFRFTAGMMRPLSRDSDFTANIAEELSSTTVTITPLNNFKDFSIEMKLTDSKNNTIVADTKQQSDVRKGLSYSFVLSHGLLTTLQSTYFACACTGRLSLF